MIQAGITDMVVAGGSECITEVSSQRIQFSDDT